MLTYYLALGLIGAGGGGPITDTGDVVASNERTAVVLVVQAGTSVANGIPLGAVAWRQQFDPGDHAPYAVDFTALLEQDEKIAEIDAIVMNATAALLGVGVDSVAPFGPIIDATDGKKMQLWFVVDEVSWASTSFNVSGVLLPVTVRIVTDSTPPKRYERTGVLTVRQL